MNKFNRARKRFGSKDFSSESSANSVIYISSDEEASDGWDSDGGNDKEVGETSEGMPYTNNGKENDNRN